MPSLTLVDVILAWIVTHPTLLVAVCRSAPDHSDGAFQFFRLPFRDEARRKILWDNCARPYNLAAK